MSSPALRALAPAALLLLTPIHAGPEAARGHPGQEPATSEPPLELPGTPEPSRSWRELLRRESEISFRATLTANSALADLDRPGLSPERRTAALMALGCAGAVGERARLESWAVEGDVTTRVAAVLALGELGLPDPHLVIDVVHNALEPEIAEAALVALLRSGSRAGHDLVNEIAANTEHAYAGAASQLLVFYLDPTALSREKLGGERTRAARTLLELRFDAARRHGLVRDQAWSVLVLQDLCKDEAFLDRVMYQAGAEVRQFGVRDHFLEILLDGPPAGVSGTYEGLKGAVEAMPSEINALVDSGLWVPPDSTAWRILLEEIDRLGLEALMDGALSAAYRAQPELEIYAAALLVRAGVPGGLGRLELALGSESEDERAQVALALGHAPEEEYHEVLQLLEDDPSARVRASALVARLLMGREDVKLELSERYLPQRKFRPNPRPRDPDEDKALFDALSARAGNSYVRSLLLDLFVALEEPFSTQVATALTASGRSDARSMVRETLHSAEPTGPEGAAMVTALAVEPSFEDLALFRDLFPIEGELDLNVALTLALIENRDPTILPVLRAALWRGPWSRSCLAGALLIDVAGVDVLRDELVRPHVNVSTRDRRRVGFALGQFGGTEQVERLSERLGSGDPALQGALLGALAARTY
jgi:hypothetical protein